MADGFLIGLYVCILEGVDLVWFGLLYCIRYIHSLNKGDCNIGISFHFILILPFPSLPFYFLFFFPFSLGSVSNLISSHLISSPISNPCIHAYMYVHVPLSISEIRSPIEIDLRFPSAFLQFLVQLWCLVRYQSLTHAAEKEIAAIGF